VTVELVEGTEAHVERIVPLMSEADQADIAVLGGPEMLLHAVRLSLRCWCGEVDGEPLWLAGVGPSGICWMIGTPAIEKHKKAYLRLTRRMADEMQLLQPQLFVMVEDRFPKSLRWLRWLGFRVGPRRELMGRQVRWAVRGEYDA
jgi:hypothetical protein